MQASVRRIHFIPIKLTSFLKHLSTSMLRTYVPIDKPLILISPPPVYLSGNMRGALFAVIASNKFSLLVKWRNMVSPGYLGKLGSLCLI